MGDNGRMQMSCGLGAELQHGIVLASFPGLAQLSVACSTEKRERAWNNLSRE